MEIVCACENCPTLIMSDLPPNVGESSEWVKDLAESVRRFRLLQREKPTGYRKRKASLKTACQNVLLGVFRRSRLNDC